MLIESGKGHCFVQKSSTCFDLHIGQHGTVSHRVQKEKVKVWGEVLKVEVAFS